MSLQVFPQTGHAALYITAKAISHQFYALPCKRQEEKRPKGSRRRALRKSGWQVSCLPGHLPVCLLLSLMLQITYVRSPMPAGSSSHLLREDDAQGCMQCHVKYRDNTTPSVLVVSILWKHRSLCSILYMISKPVGVFGKSAHSSPPLFHTF